MTRYLSRKSNFHLGSLFLIESLSSEFLKIRKFLIPLNLENCGEEIPPHESRVCRFPN
jgi:hypothetical protein